MWRKLNRNLQKSMSSVNRILLNTIVTYLRTLFAAVVGLFTARWVLLSLGEDSYGLYGLVGSILVFITFLNNVLAGSVSRFFAYSIGQQDSALLNKWFNASIRIHIVIPILLIIIGGLIGTYAIKFLLNVDVNDESVALKVFYISLLASAVTMMASPFKGLLLAKQDIAQQSIIEILQSLVHLLLMYLLTKIKHNQLIVYAIMMAAETIIFQILIALRACTLYNDISFFKYPWIKLKVYVKELLVFSSWKSLMGFGQIFFNQGLAILLNVFFGTRLNAAYSVSSNVSAQSSTVSNSLMMAITPEIITRKGAGQHEDMKSLALKAGKYSSYLVLFISLPLFIDIDNILLLWLKEPPIYTNELCRFILVSLFVEKLASGQESAINACGRIKEFQISIGCSYIVSIIIAYILLLIFDYPDVIGWAFLICATLNTGIRLHYGQSVADIRITDWLKHVFLPLLFVTSVVSMLSGFMELFLPDDGLLRLLLLVSITTILFAINGWFFILDSTIKNTILSKIFKKHED